MKSTLPFLLCLLLFTACQVPAQKNNETQRDTISAASTSSVEVNKTNPPEEPKPLDCETFWANRMPKDSIKSKYIDRALADKALPENNRLFLEALKQDQKEGFAFEHTLAPIFRLSTDQTGILSFPRFNKADETFKDISIEYSLINGKHPDFGANVETAKQATLYPELSDSLWGRTAKPEVYIYTTTASGTASIDKLGAYNGACLQYYTYSLNSSSNTGTEKTFFCSPYSIDLVYENSPEVDSLIHSAYNQNCLDCPMSMEHEQTFARLKGTNNLYFVYADTFPVNNQLDAPSRALVFVNEDQQVIYLWHEEIDLFGCQCL